MNSIDMGGETSDSANERTTDPAHHIPHTTHFNFFFSAPLVILNNQTYPYYTKGLSILFYGSPYPVPSPVIIIILLFIVLFPIIFISCPYLQFCGPALQLFIYISFVLTEAQLFAR